MHAYTRPCIPPTQTKIQSRAPLKPVLHFPLCAPILTNKERGAHTNTCGKVIHNRLMYNHWEGITLLKIPYYHLYNGKLAKRYGHVPIDECPLCHKPDSCTNIVGECSYHKALTTSRHNAACHRIHAAIRKTSK